jgi:hypothetical protein
MNKFFSAYALVGCFYLPIAAMKPTQYPLYGSQQGIDIPFDITKERSPSSSTKKRKPKVSSRRDIIDAFEASINNAVPSLIEQYLEEHSFLQREHPIGQLFYDVWKKNRCSLPSPELTFGNIEPLSLFSMLEQFAIIGKNTEYIQSYHQALTVNRAVRVIDQQKGQIYKKIREVVFPHHFDAFDYIFPSYKAHIFAQLNR